MKSVLDVPIYTVQVGPIAIRYLRVLATSEEGALAEARRILGPRATGEALCVTGSEPTHYAIGHLFRPPLRGADAVCLCVAFDWRTGFWMRFPDGTERNVSTRAIGRTYHKILPTP